MVTLNTTCHAFQRKESQGESFRRKIWWPGPRCCACAANEIFGIPTSDAMIACRTHLQDCVARWNAERRRERQERKNARIIHRAIGSERVCCYGFGWLSLIAVFILLRYHRYCLSIFVFTAQDKQLGSGRRSSFLLFVIWGWKSYGLQCTRQRLVSVGS